MALHRYKGLKSVQFKTMCIVNDIDFGISLLSFTHRKVKPKLEIRDWMSKISSIYDEGALSSKRALLFLNVQLNNNGSLLTSPRTKSSLNSWPGFSKFFNWAAWPNEKNQIKATPQWYYEKQKKIATENECEPTRGREISWLRK
jgi:hypothetical protein